MLTQMGYRPISRGALCCYIAAGDINERGLWWSSAQPNHQNVACSLVQDVSARLARARRFVLPSEIWSDLGSDSARRSWVGGKYLLDRQTTDGDHPTLIQGLSTIITY
jgi:hypothetical protein